MQSTTSLIDTEVECSVVNSNYRAPFIYLPNDAKMHARHWVYTKQDLLLGSIQGFSFHLRNAGFDDTYSNMLHQHCGTVSRFISRTCQFLLALKSQSKTRSFRLFYSIVFIATLLIVYFSYFEQHYATLCTLGCILKSCIIIVTNIITKENAHPRVKNRNSNIIKTLN